jgi:hypothetical protein
MAINIPAPPSRTSDPSVEHLSFAGRFGRIPLSFYGLFAGILALALAAIPGIAMEQPPTNPFQRPSDVNPVNGEQYSEKADATPAKKRGITLKLKGFSINLGKDAQKNEGRNRPVEMPDEPQKPFQKNNHIRWFMIAACASGLIGLGVSAIAHAREKRPTVTLTAMGCSVAAITWQYVVFGIVCGVAIVVVIFVFKFIGDVVA